MKRLKEDAGSKVDDGRKGAPVAGLLIDFEQFWWYATLPQAKRWDQRVFITQWYAALARLGFKIEVIHPNQPWPNDLAMVVAPGVQMVNDALIAQFNDYAAGGGQLILTCRTGLMDRNGQLFEGPTGQPILPLIGGTIEAYDGLPEETFGQVEMDGVKHKWGVWGDLLYAEPTTRLLAKYADQFYAGGVAVTQKKHGKGAVTYCGVYADASFTNALVEKVAATAKIPVTVLPSRVQVLRRGPYRIALNYQLVPLDAPAPRGAKFLVGSRKVDPVGVAVWEE
jgi:beta-galactosidase